MLVAAVAAIEGYKIYTEEGLSNWKIFAFAGLFIFAIFMFLRKRQERNKARENYSK
jgi:preprotein translocase subunit YajC